MAAISVTSVTVLDNPSKATNPLQFEIQYECLFPLEDGELPRALARAGQGQGGATGGARAGAGSYVGGRAWPPPICQTIACRPGVEDHICGLCRV